MNKMGSSSLEVGSRIHCDGEYGTVLYVGPIEGIEGIWLGIEWDNPSRGKHSGCYKNTTYFTTKVPGAGSFIKIAKADTGISCPEAVKLKYGINDSKPPATFINLPQKAGKERYVEMVGMQKIMNRQSNFHRLTEVVLSGMLISSPGKEKELQELIPNASLLDLSQNLISSWMDVINIVQQLPFLSTLILSKNHLKIPDSLNTYQASFSVLKMLVLNNLTYCWNEIISCAILWPYVEELYVLNNKISDLQEPSDEIFSRLRCLNLDNNHIVSWREVCKLGKLTNLEELHLDNVSLESISFPNESPLEKTRLFTNLKSLFIRNNQLNQWQDISELNKLARLKSLVVSNNPVLQSVNLETARQLIIAKISELEVLHRTKIERSERRGAELDYIKRFYSEWLLNGGCLNLSESKPTLAFLTEHPTYFSLLQKHGAPDENEVKTQSSLLKDNLITVKIFSPLAPDKPVVTRRLPAEMTVGKLKALVQRIFRVAAQDVTLTLLFKENAAQKIEMDNNLRQLSFYSISDQDMIAVEW